MADDNKPPEGGDKTVETELATIKAELETAKAEAAREKSEREKLESIRAELEETRQAAKERERKALEEQGQYKTIAETQKAELETATAELERVKAEAEAANVQLKAIIDAERAAILETIPEDEREKWKDRPLDVLKDIAPMYAKQNGAPPVKPPPSGSYPPGKVDFSDMTEAEQVKYAAEHNLTPVQIVEARQRARQKR